MGRIKQIEGFSQPQMPWEKKAHYTREWMDEDGPLNFKPHAKASNPILFIFLIFWTGIFALFTVSKM